ncbi:BgTH12-03977 [Blumeria graminis f. sp. triticale]|uniref:BgTH12-03977 n=1 Tax=Blumeria graminis f. sp. triticale TaxID=1689686 RepID=A0A9W4DHU7_BLUGR|nr:BgTH12-03977 [Blumeria graminis f. sp. triticale]
MRCNDGDSAATGKQMCWKIGMGSMSKAAQRIQARFYE